jgi:hypothetical protein
LSPNGSGNNEIKMIVVSMGTIFLFKETKLNNSGGFRSFGTYDFVVIIKEKG